MRHGEGLPTVFRPLDLCWVVPDTLVQVGQGVVDKFNAARHNTAIKSAMGHPGLNKLVAREEEEKRRRKARLKVRACMSASWRRHCAMTGQKRPDIREYARAPGRNMTAVSFGRQQELKQQQFASINGRQGALKG